MNKNFKSHEMTIEGMIKCRCIPTCVCSCGCGMDVFVVNTQYADIRSGPYSSAYNTVQISNYDHDIA